jgi:hypothetical protein
MERDVAAVAGDEIPALFNAQNKGRRWARAQQRQAVGKQRQAVGKQRQAVGKSKTKAGGGQEQNKGRRWVRSWMTRWQWDGINQRFYGMRA